MSEEQEDLQVPETVSFKQLSGALSDRELTKMSQEDQSYAWSLYQSLNDRAKQSQAVADAFKVLCECRRRVRRPRCRRAASTVSRKGSPTRLKIAAEVQP